MNCPACNNTLTEVSIENIQLDICKGGCGGIWFDRFELQQLDEPHEFTDEHLVDVLAKESRTRTDPSQRLQCPKCEDVVMMRHFHSVKKEVEVDQCPKCNGYWLDDGELFKIRQQFKTEEEKNQAAQNHFSKLFDNELTAMKKESDEKAEQSQRIARMFRLITPSYYYSKLKN
ncbi:TFIIB-type zinc ribbon-containing protein [Candidatus Electrothrix sp.]|uniref:TFIIB-type zinc ribbon-containing protein n=1 Tax=Candidatus Electrothrix sp. TaxID=2170559 RepID=UPI00405639BF